MARKSAWSNRWRVFLETVTSSHFWYTLLGILGVVLIWTYLFYLALQYDVRMVMHDTFCSSEEQRDKHILVIVLTLPFFLVGVVGTISEWMAIMENRRAGRKNSYKALIIFSLLIQVATVIILFALKC
jgi:hypothetical protein